MDGAWVAQALHSLADFFRAFHDLFMAVLVGKPRFFNHRASGMEGRRFADRDVSIKRVDDSLGISPAGNRAQGAPIYGRAAAAALMLAGAFAFFPAGPAVPQARVVNYYNWSDYEDPTVLDEFTKETGIRVRYDTFDSNDTLEAKLLAGQSGYDVVVPSAYFLARQIKAGIFQQLDKSKLPNSIYLWPEIAKQLAVYDPGNAYAVNYMWGTTGIGYNVKDAKRILGSDPVIDSWDYIFDPEKIAEFKDCGIHLLDSSDDIMSAGLHYLHLDPNTNDPADLQKVTDLLLKIRPDVRKFHSSEYLNALATGEICLVVGFSGDVKQAQKRAAEAKGGVEIAYSIPREGAQLWFDNLAIPKDAPHPQEALALIDYLIKPEVAAKNTNYVSYANGDLPSLFIDKSILDDRTIYPDAATMSKFYTIIAHDQKTQRLINRLWTRIKTGE
jgi:putrescine transport system substrate-binding protein